MKKRMDLHAAENRVIYLGRRGENLANTIEIDASPMRKEFPECTFLLMVQRPGESSAYSAAIAMDGDVVSWPLTNADTGIAGDGCAEMRAMVGDTIAKTALFRTHIDESMNLPQEETPPAPQKGWLDQALAAQVKAEEAAQSAKHSADTAETTVNAVIDKATAATSSATQAAASANSAAQTAQTVADTVQAKLDNGDFVGAKGDKGDPGNVQDVRVAGVSVLKDGVANVPIATEDAPGVVSVPIPQNSGIWNDNGKLRISFATDAEISGRNGTRKSIVCANMDYAVKAAMCDGKGAAWTAEEQVAARDRMNAQGSYKHIATITIDEDGVYNVGIDRDENGMVFSVSDVYIYGYMRKTGGNSSTVIAINTITTTMNGSNNIIKLPSIYQANGAQFEANIKKSKYWRAYAVSATGVIDPNINGVSGSTAVSHRGASNVRNNEWETLTALAFATGGTAFGIGTTFDIWGR